MSWNVDFTGFDMRKTWPQLSGMPNNPLAFYKEAWRQLAKERRNPELIMTALLQVSCEYSYIAMGRPRWFITPEMTDLLLETTIDPNLENIFWPHDVMTLVFQHGQRAGGLPIRWIRIARLRSKIAIKHVGDVIPVQVADAICEFTTAKFSCQIDSGMSRSQLGPSRIGHKLMPDDKAISHADDTPLHDTSIAQIGLDYASHDIHPGIPHFKEVRKIVQTALLYYAARPEFCVAHELSRQDRYGQKGERENIKVLLMPTVKKVYSIHVQGSISQNSVKPHYRGWVLRTLRNQKYRRNTDGTFRTILVPPCAIHADLMEAQS